MEEILDFITLQIVGLRRRSSLRGYRFHAFGFCQHLWMMNGKIPVKGMQGSKPLIPSTHMILARGLDHAQEVQDSF
jgi:hypothetical protein